MEQAVTILLDASHAPQVKVAVLAGCPTVHSARAPFSNSRCITPAVTKAGPFGGPNGLAKSADHPLHAMKQFACIASKNCAICHALHSDVIISFRSNGGRPAPTGLVNRFGWMMTYVYPLVKDSFTLEGVATSESKRVVRQEPSERRWLLLTGGHGEEEEEEEKEEEEE